LFELQNLTEVGPGGFNAQALHVGDSEINDLRGANQAGLKGILVERRKTSAAPAPDRIESLRSILALLDD